MSRGRARKNQFAAGLARVGQAAPNGVSSARPSADPQKRLAPAADRSIQWRILDRVAATAADSETQRKRHLLAQMCRAMGDLIVRDTGASPAAGATTAPGPSASPMPMPMPRPAPALSPRVRQTLERLLQGDSEKQVARRLQVSAHTVHVYVKTLYRKMKVNSRGELLAKFVRVPA